MIVRDVLGLEEQTLYTVWVGGVEVNDYHLPLLEAVALSLKYFNDGYDDVAVLEVQ